MDRRSHIRRRVQRSWDPRSGLALHQKRRFGWFGSGKSFLGQMGSSRNRRGVRASLVGKAARYGHLSSRKATEDLLPYLERIFILPSPGAGPTDLSQGHRIQVGLTRELGLGASELALLLRVEEDHPSVQLLLREAEGGVGEGDARLPLREPDAPKGRRRQRTLY